MRRKAVDEFQLGDYEAKNREYRIKQSRARRAEVLETAKYLHGEEFDIYMINRDCPYTDKDFEESSPEEFIPDDLKEPPDYQALYESLVYQCPTLVCMGVIYPDNGNLFKCSNSQCRLEVSTGNSFVERKTVIDRLKPRFMEHRSYNCQFVPQVGSFNQEILIRCESCGYFVAV